MIQPPAAVPRSPAAVLFITLSFTGAMFNGAPAVASQRASGPEARAAQVRGQWSPTPAAAMARVEAVREILARRAEAPGFGTNSAPPPRLNAWQGGGIPITSSTIAQFNPVLTSDGAGGAIAAWLDFRNGNIDVYANRVDGNGDFASGWTAIGKAICVLDSLEIDPQIATDGAAGAFVVFTEYYSGQPNFQDLFVQRVTGGGAIAPGYPVNGRRFTVGPHHGYSIRADAAGGLLLAWRDTLDQARVMRLDASGNTVSGWPANGLPIGPANSTDSDFQADGTGGFYYAYASNDSIVLLRIAATGATSSGWPADGKVVAMGGFAAGYPRLARLTSGDAMVAWYDLRTFDADIYAVRVTAGGAFPLPWTINGVAVNTATGPTYPALAIADDAGGAIIVWEAFGGLSHSFAGQRITSTGGLASGWPLDGVALCPATSAKYFGGATGDGIGGVLATWDDNLVNGVNTDIYAQRLQPNGTRPAGYPAGGVVVCGALDDQSYPAITTDGASGAILAWEDYRDPLTATRVYAARILADGVVSAQASLASATAEPGLIRLQWFSPDGATFAATLERDARGQGFAPVARLRADGSGHVRYEDRDVVAGATYRYRLVVEEGASHRALGEVTLQVPASLALALEPARPNPSAGPLTLVFTLPAASPAVLELFDVSGRRALAREVESATAGRHVLRLVEPLVPGLYVVRLSQAGRRVSARMVVTE